MANTVEKFNTIAIGNIEKINTIEGSDIENLNTLEFSAGSSLAAGTIKAIHANEALLAWTVKLTATKAVMVWKEPEIYASVLTIDATNNTITNTDRVQIGSDNSLTGLYAVAMNSTTVLVGYNDIGNGQKFTGIVFTVSGTSITVGSASVIAAVDMGAELVIAAMSSSHFVALVKNDTNTAIDAYGGSISGTSITAGGRFEASATTSETVEIQSLTSSKAVSVFAHTGSTFMRTVNLSGTTASSGGSTATLDNTVHDANGSCGLTDTTMLYASNTNKVWVITEDGGSLSAGTPLTFGTMGSSSRGAINCAKISATSAAIFFCGNGGPTVQLVTIDGTSVTLDGDPLVLIASASKMTSIQLLSTGKLIAGFTIGDRAKASVITVS